ncbi:MAG: NAD(+)/NADH kinase, partial [Desulfovibrionaceae bacterium]
DGSMLGVARHFVDNPVPLIGVNFGKVGFLADVNALQWEAGLNAFLTGKACLLKRMALRWHLVRAGQTVQEGVAINDVVISRGSLSRVIMLDVSTDTCPICRVRADGLIIASPMGASGYSVSAGGPLVFPELNALTITPICPFLCNFPPMVLPYPLQVRVVVQSDYTETHLTIDGQEGMPLLHGDIVVVQGVPEGIHFARLHAESYFLRLKARGFIEEHTVNMPVVDG